MDPPVVRVPTNILALASEVMVKPSSELAVKQLVSGVTLVARALLTINVALFKLIRLLAETVFDATVMLLASTVPLVTFNCPKVPRAAAELV